MKNIKLKMGVTSIIITAVVLACVIIFNAVVGIVTQKLPLKIDLTKDKVYEFSGQTKDVMKSLDADISAYAIIPEETEGEYIDYIKEYLEKYKALSKHFSVEYIDPYKDPTFMSRFSNSDTPAGIGSVIIECGEDYEVVSFDQLYTQSSFDNSVKIDMEKKVTNAIMNVTGLATGAKIYFTTGHDEYVVENLKTLVKGEGHTVADLSISREGIPEDANIVICVAPQTDFTKEECESLDKFLDNGGRFILTAHPGMNKMEKLDAYMAEWGLKLNYDFVIETDPKSAIAFDSGMAIPAAKLNQHGITEKIADSDAIMAMPYAMSITTMKSVNSAAPSELLMTSEKAYGKTNLESTNSEKEKGDIDGPLCLAAISEKSGDKYSAVMIMGSTLCAEHQQMINEGAYLNGDFILNSLNYMSGIKVSSDIRAKKVSPETMTMTPQQVTVSMIVLQYVLPAVIILAGLFMWLKRRFK